MERLRPLGGQGCSLPPGKAKVYGTLAQGNRIASDQLPVCEDKGCRIKPEFGGITEPGDQHSLGAMGFYKGGRQ